jgi:hypothetical protein
LEAFRFNGLLPPKACFAGFRTMAKSLSVPPATVRIEQRKLEDRALRNVFQRCVRPKLRISYLWRRVSGGVTELNLFLRELTEQILQLLGALLIAWVTVRLALKRFKSEKGWERQISTVADLLVVIGEMDRLNDIWLAVETGERRPFSIPYRGSVNPTPLGGMGSSRK